MTNPDHEYITTKLLPEFVAKLNDWGKEYQQERDLGERGEFANLYRKARKLKTALWDMPVPPTDWREPVRTIALEIAAHAFLLLCDLDRQAEQLPEPQGCSVDCGEGHTYEQGYGNCKFAVVD